MKRILVVDDDEGILQLMQDALELQGYTVRTCQQGRELAAWLGEVPELILLNVYLRDADVRELCRRLKRDPQTRHLPLILYSGYLTAQEALAESLADAFLGTPFHLRDLFALVGKYLAPGDA